jgi:hypothetical protein
MSASNWAICPRCVHRRSAAVTDASDALRALYGRIAAKEYVQRVVDLPTLNTEDYRTFREDYKIYGAGEGAIHVDYSGECDHCGLSVTFEHVRQFWSAGGGPS